MSRKRHHHCAECKAKVALAALRLLALEIPDDSIHYALRSIVRRWLVLNQEIKNLTGMIERFAMTQAPQDVRLRRTSLDHRFA